MENFTRQFNASSRNRLYRLVADKVESFVMILQKMLQQPKENEEQLKLICVNEERIDQNEFTVIGITHELLKASGNLEKMFGGGKSNLMQKKSYSWTSLLWVLSFQRKTRRCYVKWVIWEADVTFKNGEPFKAFISVDPQTNELIALGADRVRVPDEIKGVKLSEQQKTDLAMSKTVAIENMISKAGNPFNAHIQINADKKGIEFKFDNAPKQSVTQHINQEQQKGVFKESLRSGTYRKATGGA